MTNNFEHVMNSIRQKAEQYLNQAPRLVAGLAERHYRDSFRNQGFLDKTLERWKPTLSGGTTLVKTGNLRGSITARVVSDKLVKVSTDIDYAPYHNYGTAILPQRKFIGKSEALNNQIKAQLNALAKRHFN